MPFHRDRLAAFVVALAMAVPAAATAQSPAPTPSTRPSASPDASAMPTAPAAASIVPSPATTTGAWTEAAAAPDFAGPAIAARVVSIDTGVVLVGQTGSGGTGEPVRAAAWTTADPTTWTDATPIGGGGTTALAVTAGPAGIVAVGGRLDGSRALAWRSEDGSTWSKPASVKGATFYDVIATDDGFLAVGARAGRRSPVATAWTSRDGVSWKAGRIASAGIALRVVRLDDGTTVAVGVLPIAGVNLAVAWTRGTDGGWTARALPLEDVASDHLVNGVAVTSAGVSAVVQWGSGATIGEAVFSSADGVTWQETLVPESYISALGTDAAGFVAMGPGAEWHSGDGIAWQRTEVSELDATLPRSLVVLPTGASVLASQALGTDTPVLAVWTHGVDTP